MSSENSNRVTLEEGDCWIEFVELPADVSCDDKIFKELLAIRPEERGKVMMYGKSIDVPRTQKSYGGNYTFSGIDHKADPVPDGFLKTIQHWVNSREKLVYKRLLVNWYMDGTEYIGAHSDSETQLVNNSPIYSFSFGATRDFILKSKQTTERRVFPLKHNTLIIMGGETQKFYKHEVPKRLRVKEPRINITMRAFAEDQPK